MSPTAALYQTIYAALTGDLWADRVYPETVPAAVARPYVVFFVSGGGAIYPTTTAAARLDVTVKVVADTLDDALTGADRLAVLLEGQGVQDGSATPLDAGSGWTLATITQGRTLLQVEHPAIYHAGHVFQCLLLRS
jgi:hypothetical protein